MLQLLRSISDPTPRARESEPPALVRNVPLTIAYGAVAANESMDGGDSWELTDLPDLSPHDAYLVFSEAARGRLASVFSDEDSETVEAFLKSAAVVRGRVRRTPIGARIDAARAVPFDAWRRRVMLSAVRCRASDARSCVESHPLIGAVAPEGLLPASWESSLLGDAGRCALVVDDGDPADEQGIRARGYYWFSEPDGTGAVGLGVFFDDGSATAIVPPVQWQDESAG